MVALDSAGYGAMQINKSVSVIVPPGVHAGLSPVTGIPLPGFPGQSTVVLIDIQSTDTVVLRGLNVNLAQARLRARVYQIPPARPPCVGAMRRIAVLTEPSPISDVQNPHGRIVVGGV